MPERYPQRHSPDAEFQHPRFDLTTIMGIPVHGLQVSKEAHEMAKAYFDSLTMKERIDKASEAELAWALRRQLQNDLKAIVVRDEASGKADATKTKEARQKLLSEDENLAFSLAVYENLILSAGPKLQEELARHEAERVNANGTYESYRTIDRVLEKTRTDLNTLLAEMFKRAGQEPKPVHLMKRALLEAKVDELESQLEVVKQKNPDVAALIEYDTIADYAHQLRTSGFIWTKSRQKLLQDVLTGALTSRPVMALMGETGSGKTAMARALSIELASREPERTVGGKHAKFERLFGSPSIKAGDTSFDYGPLLRAMTGKTSSTDSGQGKGGGVFFDDEFNTRPTDIQREILKFVSECRSGREVAVPGTALTVTVAPGFLYLAAGNPPSERYDREETGIETKREFAGNVLNVEYLEQTPDNPELYQVLLASLLDASTGRLTAVTPEEVQPEFIKDAATGGMNLNLDPKSGAFLWRFSQVWGELFKAFSYKDTILHKTNPADPKAKWHLPSFILDPGVVMSWIGQYKASPKARKGHLSDFLEHKLKDYIHQFPEEEQKTVNAYLKHFGVMKKVDPGFSLGAVKEAKPPFHVLTPREVGYLNPNVKRPRARAAPPRMEGVDVIDPETGEVIGTKEFEESHVPEIAHLQEAKDILGADNVYGPEAVKATWGRNLSVPEIPPLPYTREQLEAAKKLNMMLVLRIDKDDHGQPLTAERMFEMIEPRLQAAGKGKLLVSVDWYAAQSFYVTGTSKPEWKLVTRDVIPGSKNLDYADQTKLLRDTLAAQPDLTQAEQEAIVEASDSVLADLKAMATTDATWQQAAERLAQLRLNVNHRRRFSDVVFDHATLLETKGVRLFNGQSVYDWTNDRTSGGDLVLAGSPDAAGMNVNRWHPRHLNSRLGVSLSR
ncbi:AAA family ATPase [Candidatus Uhrbacteria bacterium]|nr:AAA family ATPase [Candidatus Uhrbacteria bacterium]